MAMGTWDIVYAVRLKNGDVLELTSKQLAAYKFAVKYIFPIIWVLFFPARIFIKFLKKVGGKK
jgi:hypothetical protein